MEVKKRKPYKKFCDAEDLSRAKPDYAVFARNLSELITAKGINPKELTAALGLSSETSISMYRNGLQFPKNPVQLIKLAAALDTTVDALIGGSHEMYVQEDDLLVYAEAFGLSPVAISNMMACDVKNSGAALNALLSHKDMKKLMGDIESVLSKVKIYTGELTKNPDAPESYRESRKELIYGKLYIAVRAFENLLEDMIKTELDKSVTALKDGNDA